MVLMVNEERKAEEPLDNDLFVVINMPVSGTGKLGDTWRPKYNPERLGIPKSDFKRKYNNRFISYSYARRFLARIKGQTLPATRMNVDVVIRNDGNRENILRLIGFDDTKIVDLEPVHRAMFVPKSVRIAQNSLTKEFRDKKRELEELRVIGNEE